MFQKQQNRWAWWFLNISCLFSPSVLLIFFIQFILISFPFSHRLKSLNYNAVRSYEALRLSKCQISVCCCGFKYLIVAYQFPFEHPLFMIFKCYCQQKGSDFSSIMDRYLLINLPWSHQKRGRKKSVELQRWQMFSSGLLKTL